MKRYALLLALALLSCGGGGGDAELFVDDDDDSTGGDRESMAAETCETFVDKLIGCDLARDRYGASGEEEADAVCRWELMDPKLDDEAAQQTGCVMSCLATGSSCAEFERDLYGNAECAAECAPPRAGDCALGPADCPPGHTIDNPESEDCACALDEAALCADYVDRMEGCRFIYEEEKEAAEGDCLAAFEGDAALFDASMAETEAACLLDCLLEMPDCETLIGRHITDRCEKRCAEGDNGCFSDGFACDDGACLPESWRCDAEDDCDGGEDEEGCDPDDCGFDEYACANGACVPGSWVCDCEEDCPDGEDEFGCDVDRCEPSDCEVLCFNGLPIPCDWVCDGEADCLSGEDEFDCNPSCSFGQFQCPDQSCIPGEWVCDRFIDCSDGSDEADCDFGCESRAPIDESRLAESVFVIDCFLDGETLQPSGLGSALADIMSCDSIPPLALGFDPLSGDRLAMRGAALTQDYQLDLEAPLLTIVQPADFSTNPCFETEIEGSLIVEPQPGVRLTLDNLKVSGSFVPDVESFELGTFTGRTDPAPLEELLGSSYCDLVPGVCNEEGLMEMTIANLTAFRVYFLSLDGPQPGCGPEWFTCPDDACVALDKVCDGVADCFEAWDEEGCPTSECDGAPIPTEEIVGHTFSIDCVLDGSIVEPASLGPILQGLVSCEDMPALGLSVNALEGSSLDLAGALLLPSCLEPTQPECAIDPDSPILEIPAADFSANPCFDISVDGQLEMDVEGVAIRILDLRIAGRFDEGGVGFSGATFSGLIDPQPLIALVGTDPCLLLPGVCDAEGLIPLRVENLSARRIEDLTFGQTP